MIITENIIGTEAVSSGEYLCPRVENGEWRRLHNEEIHSLYLSLDIVRVINSRIMRWAGHVARME